MSKTTMPNELTDQANCNQSTSGILYRGQQHILTEDGKKKEEENSSSKLLMEHEADKNKVVKHHQLCCHLHLHQQVQ
eukprot:4327697-Ditylum_brightwellii.AAC.1